MQKVDGVASAVVTLKEGRASVTLKPGNTVTLSDLRRMIERAGFTPQAATVVADGEEIRNAAGQSQIRITGVNDTFLVAPATPEPIRTELKKQTGRKLVVQGIVAAPRNNPTGAIQLTDVKVSVKMSGSQPGR